jgi:hypothetical protein
MALDAGCYVIETFDRELQKEEGFVALGRALI